MSVSNKEGGSCLACFTVRQDGEYEACLKGERYEKGKSEEKAAKNPERETTGKKSQ